MYIINFKTFIRSNSKYSHHIVRHVCSFSNLRFSQLLIAETVLGKALGQPLYHILHGVCRYTDMHELVTLTDSLVKRKLILM